MKQRTWNPAELDAPLRWRKPYLVTLDVDLFDGMVDAEVIAAVFGVMAACPSSIFRVWTAHPNQAREWFAAKWGLSCGSSLESAAWNTCVVATCNQLGTTFPDWYNGRRTWPLTNVWLGIIARTQAELDEQAPEILACPAALHWLRLVLHGRVDLDPPHCQHCWKRGREELGQGADGATPWCTTCDSEACFGWYLGDVDHGFDHIDVSGAIGKDAQPCDIEWIRDVIRQGREVGVPVYVRALGSNPCTNMRDTGERRVHGVRYQALMVADRLVVRSRNGDRPDEWPADLRVREWPEGVEVE